MYLFSKEIWVMDHDLPYVACLFTVLAGTYYKYGDLIARYFIDNMEVSNCRNRILSSYRKYFHTERVVILVTNANRLQDLSPS